MTMGPVCDSVTCVPDATPPTTKAPLCRSAALFLVSCGSSSQRCANVSQRLRGECILCEANGDDGRTDGRTDVLFVSARTNTSM